MPLVQGSVSTKTAEARAVPAGEVSVDSAQGFSSRCQEAWERLQSRAGDTPKRPESASLLCTVVAKSCPAMVSSVHPLCPILDLTPNDIWGSWAAILQSGKEDKMLLV